MPYGYPDDTPERPPFAATAMAGEGIKLIRKEADVWKKALSFTTADLAGLPPATMPSSNVDQVKALVIAIHGPVTGDLLVRYSVHLKKATDAESHPAYAAAHFRAAADALPELGASAACTPGLLCTLPKPLLARIIAAGLTAEADRLDALLKPGSCPAPLPATTPPG